MTNSNSCLTPLEILPTAQKYSRVFSDFIMKLYVFCTHKNGLKQYFTKSNGHKLQGSHFCKTFLIPSEKFVYSKTKDVASRGRGSNFLSFRVDPLFFFLFFCCFFVVVFFVVVFFSDGT